MGLPKAAVLVFFGVVCFAAFRSCCATTTGAFVCPEGKFGYFCADVCVCSTITEVCDPITGTCSSGCAPGAQGPGCRIDSTTCESSGQLDPLLSVATGATTGEGEITLNTSQLNHCECGNYRTSRRGASCSFECHCKDESRCPQGGGGDVDGVCKNGCNSSQWIGPTCSEGIVQLSTNQVCNERYVEITCIVTGETTPSESEITLRSAQRELNSVKSEVMYTTLGPYVAQVTRTVKSLDGEEFVCSYNPKAQLIQSGVGARLSIKAYSSAVVPKPQPIMFDFRPENTLLRWHNWMSGVGYPFTYSVYVCRGPLTSCISYPDNYALYNLNKCQYHGGACHVFYNDAAQTDGKERDRKFYGYPLTFIVKGRSEDGFCAYQSKPQSVDIPCFDPVKTPNITRIEYKIGASKRASIKVTWKLPTANTDIRCRTTDRVLLSVRGYWFRFHDDVSANAGVSYMRNLDPATPYTLYLSYTNSMKLRSPAAIRRVITAEAAPDDVPVESIYPVDESLTVKVTWKISPRFYGHVTSYEVRYKDVGDRAADSEVYTGCTVYPADSEKAFSCYLEGLTLRHRYHFTIRSNNSVGSSPESVTFPYVLDYAAPSSVRNLSATSTTTSIYFKWEEPESNGGSPIWQYVLEWSTDTVTGAQVKVNVSTRDLRPTRDTATSLGKDYYHGYNFTGLTSGQKYLLSARAVAPGGVSEKARLDAYTKPADIHEPGALTFDPEKATAYSVTVNVPLVENVGFYRFIVEPVFDLAALTPDQYLIKNCVNPASGDEKLPVVTTGQYTGRRCYMVAEFASYPETFTVGKKGSVDNPPLEYGDTMRVWLVVGKDVVGEPPKRNYTFATVTVEPFARPVVAASGQLEIPAIAGVICGVLVLLSVLVGVGYYFRHRLGTRYSPTAREKERNFPRENGALLLNGADEGDDDLDMTKQPGGENVYDNVETKNYDVLMYELKDFIALRKEGDGFKREYMAIPWGLRQGVRCSAARKPENKMKNRYGNIIAYDHSRVELYEQGYDVDTDYINANYIDGYNQTHAYIATQGPTKITVNDFWRMVWQEKSSCIVMVTNLVEVGRAKCDQYWSDSEPLVCGRVKVTLTDTKVLAYFAIRTFLLEKNEETRTVKQFHFTSWPDHGVPSYPTALLSFVTRVRSHLSPKDGPIISHCSAGVGRTGTYIALDSLLRQADLEGKIGVYRFVINMRKQRCNMIQTLDQYIFLHEAILEAYYGMDTESTVDQFPVDYREMTTVNIKLKKSPLEDQYEKLDEIDYEYGTDEALSTENIIKNRNPTIVPYAERRVRLSNNEYINASFADDYLSRNSFIATQSPLANTVETFWHMVYENRVKAVVMINGKSSEEESFVEYWPSSDESLALTDHSVHLLSMKTVSLAEGHSMCVKTFEVRPVAKQTTLVPKDDMRRYVEHLTVDFWPEDCPVPASREAFAGVVREASRFRKTPADVVLVHCMDSARQTGLFLSSHIVLQQIEEDNSVNVFEIVKGIRNSSPHFIACVEQYRFLYDLALDAISIGTDEQHREEEPISTVGEHVVA